MSPKGVEQKALRVGMLLNIFIGLVGLFVYYITGIEALFIDAYYSILILFSSLIAIFISRVSSRSYQRFPNGLFILEPVYALFKSLLSLVLLILSTVAVTQKAYLYFFKGVGEVMNVGPVIPYAILMLGLGLALSSYFMRKNQELHYSSTILSSEAKTSKTDALLSAGIGVAAMIVWMIDPKSSLGFLSYTGDFFITVIIVIFAIKEPYQLMKESLFEIGGAILEKGVIRQRIESCVQKYFISDQQLGRCLVYKKGKFFQVYLKLSDHVGVVHLDALTQKKYLILQELKQSFEFIEITYIY